MNDITWLQRYNGEDVDFYTKEWLDDDYYYRKLIKSVSEAESFNYQSDYWGDAEDYREENVELMTEVEPYIGQRCKALVDDEMIEFTVDGIMIDKKYNSIGHTIILISDVSEDVTASTKKAGLSLELVDEYTDDKATFRMYTFGRYKVETDDYGDGKFYVSVMNSDNDRFLPELYVSESALDIQIQTGAYGALSIDEIQRVIEGYQYAIEAAEILKRELRA